MTQLVNGIKPLLNLSEIHLLGAANLQYSCFLVERKLTELGHLPAAVCRACVYSVRR